MNGQYGWWKWHPDKNAVVNDLSDEQIRIIQARPDIQSTRPEIFRDCYSLEYRRQNLIIPFFVHIGISERLNVFRSNREKTILELDYDLFLKTSIFDSDNNLYNNFIPFGVWREFDFAIIHGLLNIPALGHIDDVGYLSIRGGWLNSKWSSELHRLYEYTSRQMMEKSHSDNGWFADDTEAVAPAAWKNTRASNDTDWERFLKQNNLPPTFKPFMQRLDKSAYIFWDTYKLGYNPRNDGYYYIYAFIYFDDKIQIDIAYSEIKIRSFSTRPFSNPLSNLSALAKDDTIIIKPLIIETVSELPINEYRGKVNPLKNKGITDTSLPREIYDDNIRLKIINSKYENVFSLIEISELFGSEQKYISHYLSKYIEYDLFSSFLDSTGIDCDDAFNEEYSLSKLGFLKIKFIHKDIPAAYYAKFDLFDDSINKGEML